MLIPQGLLTVREYDAVYTVTPTSRFAHHSDSVFATVEMLVVNDQADDVTFPFIVLSTDPGTGAEDRRSVEPRVLNGSREVELEDAEIDEAQLAEVAVQRAQAAGVTDPAKLEQVRSWARQVLARAERTKIGRTRIKAGEQRRIVLQQRLRVLPGPDGQFVFETIAPSPIAALAPGGRMSLMVLLPWEDDDVRPQIVDFTREFEAEQGRIKQRQWVAWSWRYDPVFRLVYRYT
jgi:hypothetical protein